MAKLHPNAVDLIGQRFGRLTVISHEGRTSSGNYTWLCLCDCGMHKTFASHSLREKDVLSCGCLRRENMRNVSFVHGHAGNPNPGRWRKRSPTYETWCAIVARCYNPKHKFYKYYGARSISMTKSWRDSFESFLNEM